MFKLGARSMERLKGVHPDLVAVVCLAIKDSPIDFGVIEGLRTVQQQVEYIRSGASTTVNSRHIPNAAGVGHATDLAPFINGTPRWDWPLFFRLAAQMKRAAIELNIPVVWGGVWDKPLSEIGDPEKAVENYVARRKKMGLKAFIDGPHFELDRKAYP